MSVATVTKTERPIAFQGDLSSLPKELAPLKAIPNWVCWSWEWKVNKRGEGKWDKPPRRPSAPNQYALNNNPSTWGTYEQALAVFEAGRCDGIGFNLLGTDIAAFDIDNCRDKLTGEIAAEGQAIVDRATSYTEMTVSGTGLRVIGYGDGKSVHRKQCIPGSSVEIESYSNATRYIVITGNPLPGTWPHISDIGSEIETVVAELDGARDSNVLDFRSQSDADFASLHTLPDDLARLINYWPPPTADLSKEFHHAICWLSDCGWQPHQIDSYIAGKPIVPARYRTRLLNEIERCIAKARPNTSQPSNTLAKKKTAPAIELFWHGKDYDRPLRSWLIKELVPETGFGLASGQWGGAKTFSMIDLSASIMTATPFAGRAVDRQGGVLFVAAEGASEIPIRLQGVVDQKLRPTSLSSAAGGEPIAADLDNLPFAWVEECPNLKDNDSFERLIAVAKLAAQDIENRFGLPLALIIIDTLSAAANIEDGNSAAEGQFIMNRLGELSRRTGAFTLAVDHFGKAVETGTRGTSAKEAAADVVLALLADREINGTISNTRLAVRKLRGGKTGTETPFDLKVVDLGNGETTCIIDWKAERSTQAPSTAAKERWPNSLRIFRAAMTTALIDHGKLTQPYAADGPTVRTVSLTAVRLEFMASYAADASEPGDKGDAKRKAFTRSLKMARERDLIGSREVGGADYLWFVEPDKPDTTADKQDTP